MHQPYTHARKKIAQPQTSVNSQQFDVIKFSLSLSLSFFLFLFARTASPPQRNFVRISYSFTLLSQHISFLKCIETFLDSFRFGL